MKAHEPGKVTLRLDPEQYKKLFRIGTSGHVPSPIFKVGLRLADSDNGFAHFEFDAILDTLSSEIDPEFPSMRILSVSLSQVMTT